MTIQITKPEVEALINQRLESGAFRDAEDVILQALQSLQATPHQPPAPLPRRVCGRYSKACEAGRMTLISAAARPPDARSIYRERLFA
jgi:hypothetical protein